MNVLLRVLRFLSRISIRLLAFNLLLFFLPALAFLSLKTHERQLLDLQERSMVQQGRVLAAALGNRGAVSAEEAERILVNMRQRLDARLRVFDPSLSLIADSSRLGPQRGDSSRGLEGREGDEGGEDPGDDESGSLSGSQSASPSVEDAPVRERLIYRIGSVLYETLARQDPPQPPNPEIELDPTRRQIYRLALQDAFEGRYKPRTVASPEGRSLILYVPIPVFSGEDIVAVVLVSKSTFPILKMLWDFRVEVFQLVLTAAAAAAILSLMLSTTIARPLHRLRSEARALVDRRGRLKGRFKASRSLDEIGDLSRALAGLTDQLEGHLQFIESFASDVSHEFKNPLAAIRTATELLAEIEEPAERQRFIAMIFKDLARLEHLLTGVREISRIDTHLDDGREIEPADLRELLTGLVERYELGPATCTYHLHLPDRPVKVRASPERLAQIFENLLDNASSFSPPDGEVTVCLEVDEKNALASITDQGPGIPEEHLERIFGRFFTYRPDEETRNSKHTGLGLAIVRAIADGYGGHVRAGNSEHGGAIFKIELPLTSS